MESYGDAWVCKVWFNTNCNHLPYKCPGSSVLEGPGILLFYRLAFETLITRQEITANPSLILAGRAVLNIPATPLGSTNQQGVFARMGKGNAHAEQQYEYLVPPSLLEALPAITPFNLKGPALARVSCNWEQLNIDMAQRSQRHHLTVQGNSSQSIFAIDLLLMKTAHRLVTSDIISLHLEHASKTILFHW